VSHVFRFFLPSDGAVAVGEHVQLSHDDAHRMHKVLRLEAGEAIEVADGSGRVFAATVDAPKLGTVLLAQSGPRADDAVEKLVELGVAEIGPLLAAGRRREARTDRWERIAAGAAAQAKLPCVPAILEPIAYVDALGAGAIVCSHEEHDTPLADALARAGRPVTLLIGPEAGFGGDELAQARAASCPIVTLGGTVLRTETAAIVAAALVRECLAR
jgi:16S rRNA (uracil1498-N3)-methyltransferase